MQFPLARADHALARRAERANPPRPARLDQHARPCRACRQHRGRQRAARGTADDAAAVPVHPRGPARLVLSPEAKELTALMTYLTARPARGPLTEQPSLRAQPSNDSDAAGTGRHGGRTQRGDSLRDPARLAALRRLAVMDTPAEEAFDRLTRLATRILGVPVSLVSLVDDDRQFFKSAHGLPEPWASRRETPLSHSFCQHVVAARTPLVVEDAREHPVVRDNLAIPDIGVVAYAGVPLKTADGHVLGSLCAIDRQPRAWTDEEVAILADLAGLTKRSSSCASGRRISARPSRTSPTSSRSSRRTAPSATSARRSRGCWGTPRTILSAGAPWT